MNLYYPMVYIYTRVKNHFQQFGWLQWRFCCKWHFFLVAFFVHVLVVVTFTIPVERLFRWEVSNSRCDREGSNSKLLFQRGNYREIQSPNGHPPFRSSKVLFMWSSWWWRVARNLKIHFWKEVALLLCCSVLIGSGNTCRREEQTDCWWYPIWDWHMDGTVIKRIAR